MKLHLTLTLLLFSLIAFSQGNPRYLAKPIDKRGPIFCTPLYDGSYLALGYGARQKQIAFKAHLMLLPYRYLGKFTTDIDYRTPYDGNRYFDIQVHRNTRIQFLRHSELGVAAGYKRIKLHHEKNHRTNFHRSTH